jgi:hypothetical protein
VLTWQGAKNEQRMRLRVPIGVLSRRRTPVPEQRGPIPGPESQRRQALPGRVARSATHRSSVHQVAEHPRSETLPLSDCLFACMSDVFMAVQSDFPHRAAAVPRYGPRCDDDRGWKCKLCACHPFTVAVTINWPWQRQNLSVRTCLARTFAESLLVKNSCKISFNPFSNIPLPNPHAPRCTTIAAPPWGLKQLCTRDIAA